MLLCTKFQPPFTKRLPHQKDKSYISPRFEGRHIHWEFFSNRKNKCVFPLPFSVCYICLRWGPFCSHNSDSNESESVSIPQSVSRFWTWCNGCCRWGHTRGVPSVLREIAYIKWMGKNMCHEEEKKNLSVLQSYQGFQ